MVALVPTGINIGVVSLVPLSDSSHTLAFPLCFITLKLSFPIFFCLIKYCMRRILLKLFTITTVLFLGYIVPSYAAEDFCTSLEFSVIGPEFASKSVIQNYYASVQYLRTGVSLDVLSSVLDTATMRRDARITWEVLKA